MLWKKWPFRIEPHKNCLISENHCLCSPSTSLALGFSRVPAANRAELHNTWKSRQTVATVGQFLQSQVVTSSFKLTPVCHLRGLGSFLWLQLSNASAKVNAGIKRRLAILTWGKWTNEQLSCLWMCSSHYQGEDRCCEYFSVHCTIFIYAWAQRHGAGNAAYSRSPCGWCTVQSAMEIQLSGNSRHFKSCCSCDLPPLHIMDHCFPRCNQLYHKG